MKNVKSKAILAASALIAVSSLNINNQQVKAAKKDNNDLKTEKTEKQDRQINHDRILALKTEKANLEAKIANTSDKKQITSNKAELNRINSILDEGKKTKKTAPKKVAEKKTVNKATAKAEPIQIPSQVRQEVNNQIVTQLVSNQTVIKDTSSDVSLNTGDVSKARQKLLDMAKSLIGVPYVWGGTDPKTGLDCSGLTSYCYLHALGINTGRTTYNQDATGKHISLSELKPGDLILEFGKGHVAMYAGNGMQIAAPEPGDHVKIQPVPYNYGAMYGLRYID